MGNLLEMIAKHQEALPVNVEALIRELGLELDKEAELPPDILGQIQLLPNGKYKISANKNDHYFRRRFTIAHELGHFLLHKDLIGTGVDDDTLYRSGPTGNFYNTQIKARQEAEANKFAAGLLMPAAWVHKLWRDTPNFRSLAAKFLVSPSAMKIRAEGLGLREPTAATTSA